jgi:hypothetical protein
VAFGSSESRTIADVLQKQLRAAMPENFPYSRLFKMDRSAKSIFPRCRCRDGEQKVASHPLYLEYQHWAIARYS